MRLVWVVIPILLMVSMIGIIGMQESFAEENEFLFDDDPNSIQYFVENGFEIYTIHDPYGNYYIPYQSNNVILNSVSYYTGVHSESENLVVDVDANNNSTLTIILPEPLIYVNYESTNNFIAISINDDYEFTDLKQKSDIHHNSIITMNFGNATKNMFVFHNGIPMAHKLPDPFAKFNFKTTDSIYFDVFPPKKQIQNNISIDEILCKDDLQLIFKPINSPACVTPQTAEKLIQRGWTS